MNTELEKAMLGQVLEDGWVICGSRTRSSVNTGACHSVGFTADHPDGRKAFVKAMERRCCIKERFCNDSALAGAPDGLLFHAAAGENSRHPDPASSPPGQQPASNSRVLSANSTF